MTSTTPKSIDLNVPSELVELGFKEVYCLGKTMVLCTQTQTIPCKLDRNDLVKTTDKYLRTSLDKTTRFTAQEKEIICTHISQMFLDSTKLQSDKEQHEEQREQNEIQVILDEINQMREQNGNITFEQWRIELQVRYQKLYDTIQNAIPEIWPGLEFELSVLRILNIENCTLPFIGILLGRPSSYKTVIVNLLKKWPYAFYTDNFTARSFVSHSTAVGSREELEEIDMLPKIKDRLFLTPELSPMFTTKEEDLVQLLGIITRIADGHGYVSDSGAHGHRGYGEDIMFSWIGAAVDIPYKVYKILGYLGAKLYFFRMGFDQQTSDQLLAYAVDDEEFNPKVLEIKNLLLDYLKWFETCPDMKPKIKMDKSKDSRDALKYIAGIADLLSFLRCTAVVWETYGSQGSEYAYSISQREVPRRAITCLKNLARGHALLTGLNYITLDDIPMIIKTGLDTAAIERVSMFSLLVANNGTLTTDQILDSLRVSRPTALRTMAEFNAIGLVTIENTDEDKPGRPSKRMVLNPRFDWFLTDELIKKIIPHTTPKNNTSEFPGNGNGLADKEDLFWHEYQLLELAEKNDPSNYSADKNTVNGTMLVERLIMTGQFYKGDPEDMIKSMVEAGKLEMVMVDTYRRKA
jgi:hypothetical protein